MVRALKYNKSVQKVLLSSNRVKAEGAEALFQLAKCNPNITMLSIDCNPGELRYSDLIKEACQGNMQEISRKSVPVMKNRIKRLKTATEEMDGLTSKLKSQRQERVRYTTKLRGQLERLNTLQAEESRKFDGINGELNELKAQSQALSNQLAKLNEQIMLSEVRGKKNERTQFDQTQMAVYEIKELENGCELEVS